MILVASALLAAIAASATGSDLVEVWGIARCPDTSRFVHNQLVPFYNDFYPFPKNFKIDFHAVPTGGSMINGSYVNKCLHGSVECALNKLQMCSRKYISKDWLVTIGCIQGKKTYDSGITCIPDGAEGKKVIACAESEEGEYLLNDENSYRYNVAPQSAWLPWIQINGVRVQEAEKQLKAKMCELDSMKTLEQCKKSD